MNFIKEIRLSKYILFLFILTFCIQPLKKQEKIFHSKEYKTYSYNDEKVNGFNPTSGKISDGYIIPKVENATNAIKFNSSLEVFSKEFSKIDKDKIGTTIADLEKAKLFLEKNSIRDFQGIIDTKTGNFFVIDPDGFKGGIGSGKDTLGKIDKWITKLKGIQNGR